jgi:periplasmic divalent cation tolerance protein
VTEDGLAVVLCTAPDAAAAEALARALVEERLAACAQLVPGLTSVYRWDGAVRADAEVLILMKTRRPLVPALFRRAAELHPYDVPELVSLAADQVADAYARWVAAETGGVGQESSATGNQNAAQD